MIEPVTILLTVAGTLTIILMVITAVATLLNNRAISKAQTHLEGQDKTAEKIQGLVDTRLSATLAELEQSRAATIAVSAKLDLALARIISMQAFIDGAPGVGAGSHMAHAVQADAILAAAQLAAAQLTATAQIAADKVLADAPPQPSPDAPMPVRLVAPATLDVRVVEPTTPTPSTDSAPPEETPHA